MRLPLGQCRNHHGAFPFFRSFHNCLSNKSSRVNTSVLQPTVQLTQGVEWDDRIALQHKWTNEEKGWKVQVEWRTTPFGVGLFASQDIAAGQTLRNGKNGINLLEFKCEQDIETFLNNGGGGDTNENVRQARLRYVADYMWGFNPNATEEQGYYDPEKEDQTNLFFGMWIPGNGLNHSPQPNTVYRSAKGGTDEGIDLIAIRNISKDEEMFDDYRRHGTAPRWLFDFAEKYNVSLNFAECNDFVKR